MRLDVSSNPNASTISGPVGVQMHLPSLPEKHLTEQEVACPTIAIQSAELILLPEGQGG